MSIFLSVFSLWFFVLSVGASEPIVAPEVLVIGKRLRSDHRSARVWTETDFARESGRTLGEVLRESAGVDFTSGTSGNAALFIRGASGSETLVLIDGVKANDPSVTNRLFDWTRIDISEIERVEILKGPQAVAYGSDAIGGVVLITTRRGSGVGASIEAGSEAFARARATLGTDLGSALGADHTLDLQAVGKGVFEGGSSALSASGAPTEGDDSREATAQAGLRSRWGRTTRSNLSVALRAARTDIDAGAFDDDVNSSARNREIRTAGTLDGSFSGGTEWGALASYLDFRRDYLDAPDVRHAFGNDTSLSGTGARAEFHVRARPESVVEWTLGSELTRESADEKHDETAAIFAESVIPLDVDRRLSVDFGGRYSHFRSFGGQGSGKGGATFKPGDALEFDIGVSTGFKAPALYSLYDPIYGNPALRPEESIQAEAGAQWRPSVASTVSLRGFTNRIRNRFGFDPVTFRSLNIARAQIDGVELEGEYRVSPALRVASTLTYLASHDFATSAPLVDVPRWKGTLKMGFDFSSATSATLSFVSKSDRVSSVATQPVRGFFRADLNSRHRLSKTLTFTSRFENLFDRDYSEVRGYRTPGLSVYFGLEFATL